MFCSPLRSPVSILQAGSTRYSSCTSQPPCPLSSTTGWGTASMMLTGSRLYVADPVKPTCALLVQGLLPHAHMEPLSCLLGVSCPTIPSSSEALTAMSTSSTLGMVCLSSMELISMQEVSVKAKLWNSKCQIIFFNELLMKLIYKIFSMNLKKKNEFTKSNNEFW